MTATRGRNAIAPGRRSGLPPLRIAVSEIRRFAGRARQSRRGVGFAHRDLLGNQLGVVHPRESLQVAADVEHRDMHLPSLLLRLVQTSIDDLAGNIEPRAGAGPGNASTTASPPASTV